MIGSSQVKIGRVDSVHKDVGLSSFLSRRIFSPKSSVYFGQSIRWRTSSPVRLVLKAAARPEELASRKASGNSSTSRRGYNPIDRVRLYVGLPLDAVSDCNTINHGRAIAAGLRALKLLGVDGVELPIWWGVAEKEAMGKYEWSGYLALAEMVRNTGLDLHISLCFHASSTEPKIPFLNGFLGSENLNPISSSRVGRGSGTDSACPWLWMTFLFSMGRLQSKFTVNFVRVSSRLSLLSLVPLSLAYQWG